jgi:hypothetical protein
MSLTHEVRGSLAKCLATENIIVEHKNVDTAMFDVDKRILTLPNWKKASDIVYQMLILHETSHAIFSHNFDYTKEYENLIGYHEVVNVIEDARVEKLMKKKYPGSSKTFYTAYNELNDDDFFSTRDEDLNELSLIDRINLYFKIGAFHQITFNEIEDEFVTRISKAETFDDVLEISQDLVNYVKKKKEEKKLSTNNNESDDGEENIESSSSSLENDSNEEKIEDHNGKSDDSTVENKTQSSSGDGVKPDNFDKDKNDDLDDLESKTSRSFDEKSKNLNQKTDRNTSYVELPEFDLSKLILPNDYIHRLSRLYYEQPIHKDYLINSKVSYDDYKKSAEKEVSYLVKEFECKKSADAYARSNTAKTGVLNTSVLHTYKYNEDLFKKVSVLPDGKNHGLVFILDWSGSMADYLLDTYKQLINLIWFCRKVNIPFEVYAFTQDVNAYLEFDPNHTPIYTKKENVLWPIETFRLMNIFTSKVNNIELDRQLLHFWAICSAFQTRHGYVPFHLNLSGTPLAESIIALNQILLQFFASYKIQKANVVFLTDGEGNVNPFGTLRKTNHHGEKYLSRQFSDDTVIRNRKTGRMYPSYNSSSFSNYAKILLNYVKDLFPNVNLINFRVTPTRDLHRCYNEFGTSKIPYETIKEQFRKNKFISFDKSGFDKFFVLSSLSMNGNIDLNVDSGSSKTAIKSAFTKMLKNKKTNKKVLSEFVSLIC